MTFPGEDDHYYDPWADEAPAPWPSRMYEGTGIGALYGEPLRPWMVLDLAGWTIRPARTVPRLEGWDFEPSSTPGEDG